MYNIKDFKDIPGFEGIYKINKLGVVISLKYGKIKVLKQSKDKCGYMHIGLSLNKRYTLKIHRLMLLTFIGKSDNQVNHKNGIKTDNRLENLEYCTNSENQKHRFKVLGHKGSAYGKYGKDNWTSKSVKQISLSNKLISIYDSIILATENTGISNCNIGRVCNGKRKTAGGFIWKYS